MAPPRQDTIWRSWQDVRVIAKATWTLKSASEEVHRRSGAATLRVPVEEKTMEEEEVIEDLVEQMNNVSVVERCINDWTTLLQSLKGEAKVTEEEEQSRAADGREGYVDILLNSGECIGRLKARLKRIQRKLDTKQRTSGSS